MLLHVTHCGAPPARPRRTGKRPGRLALTHSLSLTLTDRLSAELIRWWPAAAQEDAIEQLDYFASEGFGEIDTARMYANGETEEMLGRVLQGRDAISTTGARRPRRHHTPPPHAAAARPITRSTDRPID